MDPRHAASPDRTPPGSHAGTASRQASRPGRGEATEPSGTPIVQPSVQSPADVTSPKTAQSTGRRRRKNKKQTKASSSEESRGSEQAKALELYVLVEGPPRRRVWRIYSRESGFDLGWWSPSTGRYHLRGKDGSCSDRLTVLRIAAGRPHTRREELS